jgi:hypothetical protein
MASAFAGIWALVVMMLPSYPGADIENPLVEPPTDEIDPEDFDVDNVTVPELPISDREPRLAGKEAKLLAEWVKGLPKELKLPKVTSNYKTGMFDLHGSTPQGLDDFSIRGKNPTMQRAGAKMADVTTLDFLKFATKVIIWAPEMWWNSSVPIPKCPGCGKSKCVHRSGWAPPRRIMGMHGPVFLLSSQFKCLTCDKSLQPDNNRYVNIM